MDMSFYAVVGILLHNVLCCIWRTNELRRKKKRIRETY